MENAEAKLANFYEKLILIAKKTGKTLEHLGKPWKAMGGYSTVGGYDGGGYSGRLRIRPKVSQIRPEVLRIRHKCYGSVSIVADPSQM